MYDRDRRWICCGPNRDGFTSARMALQAFCRDRQWIHVKVAALALWQGLTGIERGR